MNTKKGLYPVKFVNFYHIINDYPNYPDDFMFIMDTHKERNKRVARYRPDKKTFHYYDEAIFIFDDVAAKTWPTDVMTLEQAEDIFVNIYHKSYKEYEKRNISKG